MRYIAIVLFVIVQTANAGPLADWKPYAQREALLPEMRIGQDYHKVQEATGDFKINGAWRKIFEIEGGKYYRFSAEYSYLAVETPRRAIVAKIDWRDANHKRTRRPEYPATVKQSVDWNVMQGVYQAPDDAETAVVDLIFRWTKTGKVEWRNIKLEECEKPSQRNVKLAAINFRPRNSSGPEENLERFKPFVEQAGKQNADIVCLPEGITVVGTGKSYVDVSEPIPGLSTNFLSKLAKEHEMYIVAGIYEQAGDTVYNTAIMLDRKGELVGKYRKVALPREEIEGGITPGDSFPVFQTDFGKVGMMICWDVHFPEAARRLSYQGAEIILMPIWGGNEELFEARTIENQLYLVSSSYDARTGIWDRRGQLVSEAKEEGSVAYHTVDLNERTLWKWLGDFGARIPREAPPVKELSR